jgi:hypothetical protein
MKYTIHDCETFPNFFCCVLWHLGADRMGVYEVSERRDDSQSLAMVIPTLQCMVGFNNLMFDYPLIHWLCQAARSGELAALGGLGAARRLYNLAQEIIASPPGARHRYTVWDRHQLAPQLDLMRVHHLDNRARATSLKALQVTMRSPHVQEMPWPVGTWLTPQQMDDTIGYCCHDVLETGRLLHLSEPQIKFRETLGREFLSASDASIGKSILRRELERRSPGCTGLRTVRDQIALTDLILPQVQLRSQPFLEVLDKFRSASIPAAQVRQAFPDVRAHHRGITYRFGVGGLHGSVERRAVAADAVHEILDVDVTSYYPSLAIVNKLRPAHLGQDFCEVYAEVFARRQTHAKGSPENAALKLALNAVFGDSGNPHSRGFFDVGFMLSITVNGQLLLCMLAEALGEIPGAEILQANTDGITVLSSRARRREAESVLQWWQSVTGLKLETAEYRRLWLRDVNNYLAERVDGKVKRKGAYEYKIDWWDDPSALCVPRAAEAALVHGQDIRAYLSEHLQRDPWDFLIRARMRGKDRLEWGGMPAQRTTRYYVAVAGHPLVKIAPPLAGKVDQRITRLQGGRPVVVCDCFDGRPPADIDLNWYTAEVDKLLHFRH